MIINNKADVLNLIAFDNDEGVESRRTTLVLNKNGKTIEQCESDVKGKGIYMYHFSIIITFSVYASIVDFESITLVALFIV
jgi:hypothetical protein